MIDDLRPYPEMKPSGLPWLGEVPAHWDVRRSKYVFQEVDKRSTTGEETHLSMSQRLGLVPAGQITRSLVSESYVGGKLVDCDDLVLNRLKAHLGVFAYAKQSGLVSPDYTVLRPQNDVDVRYFEAVLKSPACRGELFTRAKGIVEGFWRLYTDDFYNIRVPHPPLDEQRQIVRFLNWHSGQVARLIRAKKKLIALLNEQKQAIILKAVTSGLDAQAKTKPSGIDWLGDVPEGWEVKKLKYLVRFNNGLAFKPSDWSNSGVPIIRIQNLNGSETFNYTTKSNLPEAMLIEKGDIVFSWSGNIGTSFGPFVWERDFKGYLNQHIFKLEKIGAHRRYFYYVLKAVTKHVEENTHGIIGLVQITKPQLGSISVPLAPPHEQSRIADWIDGQLSGTNAIIDRAQREIGLLQEFRTRMIADVVTGKLDVRTIAASLPETDEYEVADDLSEDDELDDMADDTEDEEAAA